MKSWAMEHGATESYYEGSFQGLQVWIYEDGACILSKRFSRVFEKYDFASLDDLSVAFLEQVEVLLRR